MAGIGVKLTNIYKKNTLTTDIIGAGYSMVVTIAPMLLVIGALMIMEYLLHEIGHIINKDYGISFEKETGEQEKAQE